MGCEPLFSSKKVGIGGDREEEKSLRENRFKVSGLESKVRV